MSATPQRTFALPVPGIKNKRISEVIICPTHAIGIFLHTATTEPHYHNYKISQPHTKHIASPFRFPVLQSGKAYFLLKGVIPMKSCVRNSLQLLAITARTALLGCLMTGITTLFATATFAATTWTDWTSATAGAPGSASGTLNGVAVSYSGQVVGSVLNGTSNIWAPNSSFTGGTVTTSPSTVNDDIRLTGSFAGPQTLSFASPLVNPVFAIWSLGAPGVPATFTFNATPTFEAGGPNSLFAGQAITVAGNVVSGAEGNGVVQFTGTFSSIGWTNTFENFYAFTVGVNGPALAVPEPESCAMLLAGLGLLGFTARRRKQSAA